MRKTIFKIAAFLFSLGVGAAFVGCSNPATAQNGIKPTAQAFVSATNNEIPLIFAYGVEFTVPSATVSYQGKEVAATESALIFPDGKISSEKETILTMSGEYTIVYYATIDGVAVSAEKKFKVAAEFEEDETAPVIIFDGGFEKEKTAWVAQGEKVQIPSVSISDENPAGKPSVFVYYNYGTSQQTQVGVSGGSFIPTLEGEYVIVYVAKDAYGNETSVERSVLASHVDGGKAVSISVGEREKAVAGTKVTLPAVTVDGLYDDMTRMRSYIQFGDEEREQVKDGVFFAEHVGVYSLTYEYITPVAVYSKTVDLNVVSENVVIFDEFAAPNYYLKNAKYTVDEVFVTTYSGENPVRSKAKTYLKQDGGSYQEINCENFEITALNSVQFKFETDGKSKESPVFDVLEVGFGGDLIMENFFVGEVEKRATEDDGVFLTTKTAAAQTKVAFANVVSLSTFKIQFNLPASESMVGAVTMRLTDYYDTSKFVDLRMINEGGTATFTIGEARAVSLSRNFFGVKHNLYFESSQSCFYDYGSGISLAFENNFTSDRIFFELIFENSSENATIVVEKFGDQSFKQGAIDRTLPTLYVEKIQQGAWQLNEEILLQAAVVTDILTPYVKENLTFTVTLPDGSFAVAKDSTVLNANCEVEKDYILKLSQYGTYTVTYTYTDQNGRKNALSYPIFVYDRNGPTITLEGVKAGDTLRVKAGATVQIAKYTVFDEKTPVEQLKAYVAVYNPNGAIFAGVTDSFTTNHKGKYRIVYYCQDTDGNYTTVSYTVIAE